MDINALRRKLKKINASTSKRKDLWKPKDKHTVRALPYPHGPEPIIELAFHYDIGDNRPILCPKHFSGDDCAICDYAELLKAWKDPTTGEDKPEKIRKADFEHFCKIQAKERWYLPIVVRGEEDQGPKFWSFTKRIFEDLIKICLDPENNEIYGDPEAGTEILTDPDKAFDLNVEFFEKDNKDGKGNNKPFPITEVKEGKRMGKLAKTKKETQEILDKIIKIEEVYEVPSSADVEGMLNDWLGTDGSSSVGDDDDVGQEYEANAGDDEVVDGKSIDEAFGELVS